MSATTPGLSKSILLIDDDDLIVGSLRRVLAGSHEVGVAVDSSTARALMSCRKYDIVMIDPYLTGGVHRDGCDLIESVRLMQPAAKLIVLTGYSSPELARSAAEGQIAALLVKPQSIPFLSAFLAEPPQVTIETSIKG